jgi:hypothetical protein
LIKKTNLRRTVHLSIWNPVNKSSVLFKLGVFSFLWLLCTIGPLRSYAQQSNQEKEAINLGAICELDEQEFSVQGKNKTVLFVHRIFRIYNERGKEYGKVFAPLNEFMEVTRMEAQVKSEDGAIIKKLGKEDIHEESVFPDYVLYEKTRVRHFDLSTTVFPYILEYSYEIRFNSPFFWPEWHPQMEIPVKHSIYRLILPQGLAFNMRKRNLDITPVEVRSEDKHLLIFELTDLPPFKEEKDMPPEEDYLISVVFAPEEFELMGYPGSNASWSLFGKWYSSLASGKYLLSPEQRRTIQYLVERYPSELEKTKQLYRFLQTKTHYVAIHLGMGGYMPRSAEAVLTTGYGDCKDLSTLFIAMADAVGIRAYPALVRTKDEGTVLSDFPSNQFNHLIAFVPLEKDTLWLDCTSNYCPFGKLPWTDQGCDALVIRGADAVLIRTPSSRAEDNRVSSSINAKLALDGSVEITGQISATGNPEVLQRDFLNSKTATEKKEWLGRKLSTYSPNFTLTSSNFDNVSNLDAPFIISFGAKLIKYATKTRNELLVNLNLLTRLDADEIPNEKERKYPVDNWYPFEDQSQVVLEFPEGLTIKAVPEDKDITSPYGSFKTQYTVSGNRLTYQRVQLITQELVPPENFQDFKAFLNQIYGADRSFVVFSVVN